MNINRHNYEEFFLLYVDNELDAAQRLQVENFLSNNPDLNKEMDMLRRVVSSNEPVVEFFDKEALYKTGHGISLANYEEYFVLYTDNELSSEEKEEVEKFVLQHPSLQESFTQIRAAKLQPEKIEFKNKQSLYRYEKQRRVVPLSFLRMAVAAAFIGLISMLWIPFDNRNPTVPGKENIAQRKKLETPAKKNVQAELSKVDNNIIASSQSTSAADKKNKSIIPVSFKTLVIQKQKDRPQEKDDDILEPTLQQKTLIAKTDPPEEKKNIQANGTHLTVSLNESKMSSNANEEKSIVVPAVYTYTDDNEEDRTLYIGGARINKNKLRGLFKKAAGFFDKKTRRSDKENTVQIASFEIKTK